ncbi:MAG: metallophosphoesterase, partial [Candidatus Bathyarchaeia archaeon]
MNSRTVTVSLLALVFTSFFPVIAFADTTPTSVSLGGGSVDLIYSATVPLNQNFTIVVLPDTQGYVKDYPWLFDAQTAWIIENKDVLNIVFVTHLGDLVDRPQNLTEWENANTSMSKLDGNVPWAVLLGNHDIFYGDTTNYNTYFGVERFSGNMWFGGTYKTGDNTNSYQLFSAGGDDYLIFHLQYNPSDDMLFWANNVIDQYPSRRVIVSTHDYINGPYDSYKRSDVGEKIWCTLIKQHADQIFLVLSG